MTTSPVRPGLVLAICCLSLLIVGVDNTIVTIALPALRTDLHSSFELSQWTVDAYQLVLGALLLSAGAAADRFGRRRTLQIGLALFTAASLLCGLAPGIGWLIAFRVLQAVGGSMMNPVAMAIVSQVYPDPSQRARAFGLWSGVYGLSMAIGPTLGGVLVGDAGWRSIFWVNVPIGILAILLAHRYVPESKATRARRGDPIGQFGVIVVVAMLSYSIIEGRAAGWGSAEIVLLFAAAGVAGLFLTVWELHRTEPLIDPRWFARLPFLGAFVVALVGMGAAGGYLWVITFYLQTAREFSAVRAGALMLPIAVMVLLLAPVSGRLAARHGPRVPLVASGAALMGAGLVLVRLSDTTSLWTLTTSFILFGIGFAMLNAPITAAAVESLPIAQAGVASAVASTARQVGQALGVAIIGSIVIDGLGAAGTARLPTASRAGWWAIAVAGLIVVVLALIASAGPGKRSRDTSHPRADFQRRLVRK